MHRVCRGRRWMPGANGIRGNNGPKSAFADSLDDIVALPDHRGAFRPEGRLEEGV